MINEIDKLSDTIPDNSRIVLYKKSKKDNSLYYKIIKKSWLAFIIFLIGIIVGYFIVVYVTHNMADIMEFEVDKENMEFFPDFLELDKTPTFWSIFSNNLLVCLVLIIGIFSRGIISGIVLFINGVFTGIILQSYGAIGYSLILPVIALLPHAIFEVPALILCGSISFQRIRDFKKCPLKDNGNFLLILFLLLLIGALVESNISIKIAEKILPQ